MEQKERKIKKRAGKAIHSAVSMHAMERAKDIRARYGPDIDYPSVLSIIQDRKSTRYPVQIRFVSKGIEPGMFAKTELVSEDRKVAGWQCGSSEGSCTRGEEV